MKTSGMNSKRMSTDVIRSTVEEVMIEEWDNLRSDYSELPIVSVDSQGRTDDIDYVISIMDELTQELIQEGDYTLILVLKVSVFRGSHVLGCYIHNCSVCPFLLPQNKLSFYIMNERRSLTRNHCVQLLNLSQLMISFVPFARSESILVWVGKIYLIRFCLTG